MQAETDNEPYVLPFPGVTVLDPRTGNMSAEEMDMAPLIVRISPEEIAGKLNTSDCRCIFSKNPSERRRSRLWNGLSFVGCRIRSRNDPGLTPPQWFYLLTRLCVYAFTPALTHLYPCVTATVIGALRRIPCHLVGVEHPS